MEQENHIQDYLDYLAWRLQVMTAVLDWLVFRIRIKCLFAGFRVRKAMMLLRHRLGIHKFNGRYTRRIPYPPGVIVTRNPK